MFKKYKQNKIDKQRIKEIVLSQHLKFELPKKDQINIEEFFTIPEKNEGFLKSNSLMEVEYSIRNLDFLILQALTDKYLTAEQKRFKVIDLEKQKHKEINRKIEILKYEISIFNKKH